MQSNEFPVIHIHTDLLWLAMVEKNMWVWKWCIYPLPTLWQWWQTIGFCMILPYFPWFPWETGAPQALPMIFPCFFSVNLGAQERRDVAFGFPGVPTKGFSLMVGLSLRTTCQNRHMGVEKLGQTWINHDWLVVYLPLWKIWKSMGRIIPCIMENKKCLKPPTRWILSNPKKLHPEW